MASQTVATIEGKVLALEKCNLLPLYNYCKVGQDGCFAAVVELVCVLQLHWVHVHCQCCINQQYIGAVSDPRVDT